MIKIDDTVLQNISLLENDKIFAYKDNDDIYVLICVHHRSSIYGFACITDTEETIQYKYFSKHSISEAMKSNTVYMLENLNELLLLKN